ncbi:MAG: class I SAM-dependent methyltransferase [Deltaproteobacteria bacterium]|jgi:SAM-dependent methyltransferase|nr:class I SAM-dependent methyltransferase [Deltaproteobacteria bacterium]
MAVELTHTPTCRLCGLGPLRPRLTFRAPAAGLSGDFHLVSCDDCGTFQVNPHPGPKITQSYFVRPELWGESRDPDGRPVNPFQRAETKLKEYQSYVTALVPLLPERGLIVDVGAGAGLTLSLLPTGLPLLAVEPNPKAAEAIRAKGLDVLRDFAENLNFASGHLGALILNQTLDHLPRPDLFLGRALNWLTPGGLILISGLINPFSWPAKVYGPKHRLWSPFHQIYPPLPAVRRILRAYGFEIIRVWRPYFETPFGGALNLAKASLKLIGAAFKKPKFAVSPPWPGNVYTVLARKTLLLTPLPVAATPKTATLGHVS